MLCERGMDIYRGFKNVGDKAGVPRVIINGGIERGGGPDIGDRVNRQVKLPEETNGKI